jgi:lipopolysaccharide/colanic/teichoic acid biosynthesis glycosyltransferase
MTVDEAVVVDEVTTSAAIPHGFYCRRGKRIFDLAGAMFLLVLLFPIFIIVSMLVKLSSVGPAFYFQERVGRSGKAFRIVKFRSMVVGADRKGPGITSSRDARITRIGRVLRNFKLDELPQLWNVINGDMSLVGPRPELPIYVANYDQRQKAVLSVRPGITDDASIEFRWEEDLLSESTTPEVFYREILLPRKLDLNVSYIEKMSLGYDLRLLGRTVRSVLMSRTKTVSVQ